MATDSSLTTADWKSIVTPAFDLYSRAFVKSNDEEAVPTSALPALSAVAASIKQSAAGMSQWGMAELTLGLYKLANFHTQQGAVDTIEGTAVVNRKELRDLLHWLRWAMASYETDHQVLAVNLGLESVHIVKHVKRSFVMKPAYFIALDNKRHCVVLSIRGTSSATDVLTDLNPHSEKFEKGYAHSGMLGAAKWLLKEEEEHLRALLHQNPGYSLALCGHSLGGGAAALMTMLFRESTSSIRPQENQGQSRLLGIPSDDICCWTFGCPPCVDKDLAEGCSSFIQAVVLQDDVVARMSPGSVEDLRNEIVTTDWSKALPDGSMRRRLIVAADGTRSFMDGLEEGLGFKKGDLAKQAASLGWSAVRYMSTSSTAPAKQGPSTTQSVAAWVSTAGIFGGALFAAAADHAMKQKRQQESDEQEHRQASNVGGGDERLLTKAEIEARRLFTPGLLYHIVREPIEPAQRPPTSVGKLIRLEKQEIGGARTELELWLQPQQRKAKLQGTEEGPEGASLERRSLQKTMDNLLSWATLKRHRSKGEEEEEEMNAMADVGAHIAGGTSLINLSFRDLGRGGSSGPEGKGDKDVGCSTEETGKMAAEEAAEEGGRESTSKQEHEDAAEEAKAEMKMDHMPVRHVVIRQINRSSRFRRIVLSSTLLSDHGCKFYGDGIINAMQWTAESS